MLQVYLWYHQKNRGKKQGAIEKFPNLNLLVVLYGSSKWVDFRLKPFGEISMRLPSQQKR